jgi:SpoVK/Ycf46/Vps4 family AAA+-type ATPase
MPSAEQVKALLQSHIEGDDARFFAIAMQVAAHEAKVGHGRLAQELREMIDAAKAGKQRLISSKNTIPITQPRGELSSLLSVSYPKSRLSDMTLAPSILERLVRLIKEHRQIVKIRSHGLSPRRKLLLVGPPGTGKTLSATVLAGELSLPLFVVRLDSLITKFMGETSAKLRLVFDAIGQARGVYLFDEFDSIGSRRGIENEVGEIRRVLNSFLQYIEQDISDSIILAATNHPDILDHALFRRFDDVIEYQLPNREEIIDTLKTRMATFKKSKISWEKLADIALGLSYADIMRACEEAIKNMIINDKDRVTNEDISMYLSERKSIKNK